MITLRPMTDTDFRNYYVWMGDPEIRRLNPPAGGMTNYHAYAIDAGGGHIGTCFMMNITGESGELTIVIGDKSFWGKGYGTETVKTLVTHWQSAPKSLLKIWEGFPGNTFIVLGWHPLL